VLARAWGFESLRPHSPASIAALGAVAQLAKAPVSKTGDSRFESWLPRSLPRVIVDGSYGPRPVAVARTHKLVSFGRKGIFAVFLLLLWGGAFAVSADARPTCPEGAAESVAAASGFLDLAERHWSEQLTPGIEFAVSRAVCGRVSGDRLADMVVVLAVVGGTGGSPKPLGIFNGEPSGGFSLRHVDLNQRRLICPSSVRIRGGQLKVNRPSEYEGAWTVCDRLMRFRFLDRGTYGVRESRAFKRCRTVEVPDLRVAGIGCSRGIGIARASLYGSVFPPGWDCTPEFSPYTRDRTCVRNSWRKWLKYSGNFD
jgi:hypothetical protein